jgi:pyruvate formate lyase activating enzyme
MKFNRREFIKSLAATGVCAGLLSSDGVIIPPETQLLASVPSDNTSPPPVDAEKIFFVKEAMFYEKLHENEIRCKLCPKECEIGDRERGWCGVRENREGVYYTLVYGNPCTGKRDPIEKKPLFHFHPGSTAYSIATAGCNFRCGFCQNADISQMPRNRHVIQGHALPPEQIVQMAREEGCASIAYTYTEPTIYFEYALDTAKLARKAGIRNVFVTNGYISPEALRAIAPFLDGANVDLKSFREKFYKKICGAKLAPVLESLKLYRKLGIWLEVTTLIIPGENDSDEELGQIAAFIAGELGPGVPWHVSAFHPTYRLADRPRTPAATLRRACEAGRDAGLKYVYEGNVPGEGEDTFCPACGEQVISRLGFMVRENRIEGGSCPQCRSPLEGIWNP